MDQPGGRSSFRPTRAWIGPALLLASALAFWVPFLQQAENSVFGRVPILDEVYYLDQAAAWSAGPTGPPEAFFVSPLYPILISWTGGGEAYRDERVIPPHRLRGVRIFQILCWFGVAVLLRLLAGRLLEPGGKGRFDGLLLWLPTLLFFLYRPAAVYSVCILLELPHLFTVTLSVYLLALAHDENSPRKFLFLAAATGVVIGLAGLLRGTSLLLLVPAVIAGWRWSGPRRTRMGGLAILLGATALVLLPAVVHNSRIAGGPAGPTHNGGVNLFIGNGPEANGFYVAVVPGDWRRDPAGRAYLGRKMGTQPPSLAEADRIWREQAITAVADRPLRAGTLWLKKVWLHLQGWEIDQLTPLEGWRRAAPALNGLPVPYALVVILGLAGMAGGWSDSRARMLGVILVLLVAGQSLFFVVSRYRLVLVLLLCLLASVGVLEIIRLNRRALAVGLAAVLVAIPWGLGDTRDLWSAQARANEARRWAEVGLAEDSVEALRTAEEYYREAVAGLGGRDGGPAPWLGLASLLSARGERGEAAEVLREGERSTANRLQIQKARLGLLLELGEKTEALALTVAILEADPRDPDTLHNRAILQYETGAPAEAVESARILVREHPADPRGYLDLGVILARSGRSDEARSVFRAGLQAVPNHPGLEKNLELLDR